MSCKIIFAANAGMVISLRGKTLWVDLPYSHGASGFSNLSPEVEAQITNHYPPDILLFTHKHPDHYSQSKLANILTQYPYAQIVLPQAEESQMDFGSITVSLFPLPHSGTQYHNITHCGIFLSDGTCRLFLLGDCDVAAEELPRLWKELLPDTLIVPFPWVTITRGQQMLCQELKPKHLLIYHLPYNEDDNSGFLSLTQSRVQQMLLPDIRILSKPLQAESFE